MLVLLLALTLGVTEAGKLFYEIEQPPSDDILCPDRQSKCPSTATCCQLASGQWGCCPFVKASCCSDHEHCCPQGYSCNIAKGQCVKDINNDTIPWAKKLPVSPASSVEAAPPSNSLVCPDLTSACPGSSACCRTYTGQYRCCPYPNDVCCSDGNSCCPRCTVCDLVNRKCISGVATEEWKTLTASVPSVPHTDPETTPAAKKFPASVVATDKAEILQVVWCDSSHYCPDGNTCCRLPDGTWGCCPLPQATCCTGSYFCCPYGKRCTSPPGGCF